MARNNYSFKKRQKEIKRQKKREEKLQRRLTKRNGDAEQVPADNDPVDDLDVAPKTAADPADLDGAVTEE